MNWNELKQRFQLKTGNRNIQDEDFLLMLNEWIKQISLLWRNFDTFRKQILFKEKEVPLYETDDWRYYIKLSELDDNILAVEWEQSKEWDKLYIDINLINTDSSKAKIQYDKYPDEINNLSENLWMWIYEEAVLDYIIAIYYELRTDSIELANYYKSKILHYLAL